MQCWPLLNCEQLFLLYSGTDLRQKTGLHQVEDGDFFYCVQDEEDAVDTSLKKIEQNKVKLNNWLW